MDWSQLGFEGLKQITNIHPVFVHFPIVLFPVAFLFYSAGVWLKKDALIFSGRCCLYLAAAASIVTAVTGWLAEDTFPHSDAVHQIMEVHETLGIAILISGLLLSVWTFFQKEGLPKKPRLFLIALALPALLVLQNADLGGRMVFLHGAAVKTPLVPEALHDHRQHEHQNED